MIRAGRIHAGGARREVGSLITEYLLQHKNLLPNLMGMNKKL
jgi:hypothetical protein